MLTLIILYVISVLLSFAYRATFNVKKFDTTRIELIMLVCVSVIPLFNVLSILIDILLDIGDSSTYVGNKFVKLEDWLNTPIKFGRTK